MCVFSWLLHYECAFFLGRRPQYFFGSVSPQKKNQACFSPKRVCDRYLVTINHCLLIANFSFLEKYIANSSTKKTGPTSIRGQGHSRIYVHVEKQSRILAVARRGFRRASRDFPAAPAGERTSATARGAGAAPRPAVQQVDKYRNNTELRYSFFTLGQTS